MNRQQSTPTTTHLSSWDFGDSDSDKYFNDSEHDDKVFKLTARYNAPKYDTPTIPKPLRLRGGYNNEDNSDRSNKPGIMRVKTVEDSLTDNESYCTSAPAIKTTIHITLPYNPRLAHQTLT